MEYSEWREKIFGNVVPSDWVDFDICPEIENLDEDSTLRHIVSALSDKEIHKRYTREQIGFGLNLMVNSCYGDLVYAFRDADSESLRLLAINELKNLYSNYFEKYCLEKVDKVGDRYSGEIGFICHMFWDIFSIYPSNSTDNIIESALEVMENALRIDNEECRVSALHGLGHWVHYSPRAESIIEQFINNNQESVSPVILAYAKAALTGYIL